jgi:hypothetical protein
LLKAYFCLFVYMVWVYSVCFERAFCSIAQADIELKFFLSLLLEYAWITDMYHHACLYFYLKLNFNMFGFLLLYLMLKQVCNFSNCIQNSHSN